MHHHRMNTPHLCISLHSTHTQSHKAVWRTYTLPTPSCLFLTHKFAQTELFSSAASAGQTAQVATRASRHPELGDRAIMTNNNETKSLTGLSFGRCTHAHAPLMGLGAVPHRVPLLSPIPPFLPATSFGRRAEQRRQARVKLGTKQHAAHGVGDRGRREVVARLQVARASTKQGRRWLHTAT